MTLDWDWTFEDTAEYTPDKIFKQASDGKGHSRQVNTRFPPEWEARMHKVIGFFRMQDLGYESLSEFVRDAIIHRTIYWEQRLEELGQDEWSLRLKEVNGILLTTLQMPFKERVKISAEWISEWEEAFSTYVSRHSGIGLMKLASEIRERKDGLFEWDQRAADDLLLRIDRALGLF